MKREEFIATICRAHELLGNPVRMKIYLRILDEGCDCDIKTQDGFAGNCVSGIMKDLQLPQSTVSTYIKELEGGGLITCEKKGKFLYCVPNRERLISLKSFVDAALAKIGPKERRAA